MGKKIHMAIFIITYCVGVGCMIYLLGKFINNVFSVDFGWLVAIGIQIIGFFSLTKVENYLKQNAIDEYLAK